MRELFMKRRRWAEMMSLASKCTGSGDSDGIGSIVLSNVDLFEKINSEFCESGYPTFAKLTINIQINPYFAHNLTIRSRLASVTRPSFDQW